MQSVESDLGNYSNADAEEDGDACVEQKCVYSLMQMIARVAAVAEVDVIH